MCSIRQKFCYYLGGDKGGGGSRQTVTNGDNGGKGVRNGDFYGDKLFEWPLTDYITRKESKNLTNDSNRIGHKEIKKES